MGQEESAFGTLQVAAYTERANQMFQIAALLKQYALRYNLTVVTTNQVWLASQSCSWSWSQLVAAPCAALPGFLVPMSQAALYDMGWHLNTFNATFRKHPGVVDQSDPNLSDSLPSGMWQVSDVVEDEALARTLSSGLKLWTMGRQVLPSLGLAWTNCVNQRLFLSKQPATVTMRVPEDVPRSPGLPILQAGEGLTSQLRGIQAGCAVLPQGIMSAVLPCLEAT